MVNICQINQVFAIDPLPKHLLNIGSLSSSQNEHKSDSLKEKKHGVSFKIFQCQLAKWTSSNSFILHWDSHFKDSAHGIISALLFLTVPLNNTTVLASLHSWFDIENTMETGVNRCLSNCTYVSFQHVQYECYACIYITSEKSMKWHWWNIQKYFLYLCLSLIYTLP